MGFDPYAALTALLPRDQFPRVLNTEDLPDLNPNNPQPLFSPIRDFNNDKKKDMAISGVYSLPSGPKRFFLLVATPHQKKPFFKTLFFEEYDSPVYIHLPGTTGPSDPGDQAFSLSQCEDCNKGQDFYWSKWRKKFRRINWKKQTDRLKKKQAKIKPQKPRPNPTLSQTVIDEALLIAVELKDVQLFLQELKARGGNIGTKVNPYKYTKRNRRYWVRIFEKKDGQNILYDRLLIDLKKKKILKRTLHKLK